MRQNQRFRGGRSTMPGQNKTNPDNNNSCALSPQQEPAADLLAFGSTITETAEKVGVARQTLSQWYNQNLAFQASVNARRQELWRALCNRLHGLLPKALD